MDTQKNLSHLTIPAAIIISGAIIAIAIIWSKQPAPAKNVANEKTGLSVNLAKVTSADHILGNPDAPIKIVEYSDPSCPYCKTFDPTMQSLMSKYGLGGKVAWVYRHFPLDKPDSNGNVLHPNANHEAQSMECVAEIGGNEKFWAYEKLLYETTPSVTGTTPNGLDQSKLPAMAKTVGVDVSKFNDCLSSGRTKSIVEKNYLSGINAGVSGTPSNFIVLKEPANKSIDAFIADALISNRMPSEILYVTDDRKTIVVSGAMPKELMDGLITALGGGVSN